MIRWRLAAPLPGMSSFDRLSHRSEIEDEAVSLVEALPGQLHLFGTDVALSFDLVQPLHGARALSSPET